MANKRLYRKPSEGKLTGVSVGLADYLELDVTIIRVAFIVGALASGGLVLVIYIALAIIMPAYPTDDTSSKKSHSISNNVESLSEEIKQTASGERLRNYFGIGLILFGSWLLAVRFLPRLIDINWSFLWPLMLIGIGLFILMNRKA
jgi:phage shock protein C